MKHGFLLIDKPVGPTSHDIVNNVRRNLGEKKIGHLGTLDPAASGLMILAVGAKALKVIEFFSDLTKEYTAEVTFGAISSTYDREGVIEKIEPKPGWVVPPHTTVNNTLQDYFVGTIDQAPPAHSAVHVGGERAYKKARKGEKVDMPMREVSITKCDIQSYEFPKVSIDVACGSGTYIRSLAHDLGERLRCGGYLSALRRTKVGEWSIDFAVPLDAVGWSHVIPLREVMDSFGGINLTEKEAEDVRHGRNIAHQVKQDTFAWFEDMPIAILVPAKDGTQMAHARKVL